MNKQTDKIQMKRTLFLLSLLIGWTLQSAAQVEGKLVKVKGQGVYCGEVEMDVTQGADGKYYLYDSKRKICTLIGASLPSLDDLAANGTLRDYIRTEEDGPADDEEYIKEVLDAEKTFDATAYLKTGEVANSTSDFYAYQVKSITIEQLTKDGQDCMPTAESPSALRIALYYRQNKWTPFYEYLIPEVEEAPVVLDGDEVSQIRIAIPVEGATLEINIVDEEGEDLPVLLRAFFVPDASGVTHIDADGIKATITYEKGGSPLVDAHWGMMRVYDFYKNVFGRDSYDDKGATIYNIIYTPGYSSGKDGMDFDDPMPRLLYNMAQCSAEARSDWYPPVMIYGMGGQILDLETGMPGPYIRAFVELSIMCHEFTHIVTKNTAQLSSSIPSEGGAINESFSDIMAVSLVKNDTYGVGSQSPWIVGGQGLIIGKDNMRNLENPKISGDVPQADTYHGENWDKLDKYKMMGVQNKFYYLLCEGGKGTNDNGDSYDMTGIGIDKGMRIAYLTLTKYCSSETDFSTVSECWQQASEELYGKDSAETQAVIRAWAAVGIGNADYTGIDEINGQTTASAICYDLQGRMLQTPPSKGIYIKKSGKGHTQVKKFITQ
jgi:hypothetical protein